MTQGQQSVELHCTNTRLKKKRLGLPHFTMGRIPKLNERGWKQRILYLAQKLFFSWWRLIRFMIGVSRNIMVGDTNLSSQFDLKHTDKKDCLQKDLWSSIYKKYWCWYLIDRQFTRNIGTHLSSIFQLQTVLTFPWLWEGVLWWQEEVSYTSLPHKWTS